MIGEDSDALGSRAETKLLDRLLKRSERKLRKTCLSEASQLFSDSPKRSAKKLARKARHGMAREPPSRKAGTSRRGQQQPDIIVKIDVAPVLASGGKGMLPLCA